jgi:hypothetical protein
MTSREFLNVAHAALIEEFQRPRLIQGVMVPGLALSDALRAAEPWSEGYVAPEEEEEEEVQPRRFSALRRRPEPEQPSEDETAAQNDAALQALEGRMGAMIGGFFKQT